MDDFNMPIPICKVHEFTTRHVVPRAHFTNHFSLVIRIRWKTWDDMMALLLMRLPQNFAHVTTAQLSCHVQNFGAIIVWGFGWWHYEISIEFWLRLNKKWWKRVPVVIPRPGLLACRIYQFINHYDVITWKTLSLILLALFAHHLDVFFDVSLNKLLNKQSR